MNSYIRQLFLSKFGVGTFGIGAMIAVCEFGEASDLNKCSSRFTEEPFNIFKWDLDDSLCYLRDRIDLRHYAAKEDSGVGFDIAMRQAENNAMVGRYKDSMAIYNSDKPAQKLNIINFIDGAEARDAETYITEKAKDADIVIFNESHFDSSHRFFVAKILKKLRSIGYTKIAAEAFNADKVEFENSVSLPDVNGKAGKYVRDPVFANLVRLAKKLNYKLIAYELTDEEQDIASNSGNFVRFREKNQAKKLHDSIKEIRGKTIVIAGFDHIVTSVRDDGEKMMAGYLIGYHYRLLSIDQVAANGRMRNNDCSQRAMWTKPVIFTKHGRAVTFPPYAGQVSASVVHPCVSFSANVPNWKDFRIFFVGQFREFKEFDHSKTTLLQSFRKGQDIESVPIDQVIYEPGEEKPRIWTTSGGRVIVKYFSDHRGIELIGSTM